MGLHHPVAVLLVLLDLGIGEARPFAKPHWVAGIGRCGLVDAVQGQLLHLRNRVIGGDMDLHGLAAEVHQVGLLAAGLVECRHHLAKFCLLLTAIGDSFLLVELTQAIAQLHFAPSAGGCFSQLGDLGCQLGLGHLLEAHADSRSHKSLS